LCKANWLRLFDPEPDAPVALTAKIGFLCK
jgi:hypothetical protein